ncbi:MAG: tyrosine-protein phosphatase [Prevotella sp.]|jgi:protein-tyrosine phosphatase|nr:tyrosine-protein phosphatase [Prevotella sp.]
MTQAKNIILATIAFMLMIMTACKNIAERPEFKPLMEVRAEYLRAGIDEMKNKYGSVEKYLTEILEVDIEEMQRLYLY